MKALADVMVNFDRISTREELKQVLDLLADVNSTRNLETLDLAEVADPGDFGLQEGSLGEMDGSEYAQAELGTLANLFLGGHERAN